MDLSKLIGKGLDQAFAAVKSLSVTATFHLKTSPTKFDFASGETEPEDNGDVDAQVIVLDSRTKSEKTVYKQLLMRSIPLTLFEKVTVNDLEWTIGDPVVDNGSTQLIEIYRGI